MSKYKGIDERIIKCCCDNPNCIESGISFEDDNLRFHFLEYIGGDKKILSQTTKIMKIDRETAKEIIEELQSRF